ncbi:putative candidate secreted effector protein [Blumeria hordei DH14]|uniref:Putative candidate secreted effector protein n=1 Tax=Blumeria graminis f. sp. hordei (strain DH14) TaxID=546991 RepID=N1J710_BLUG1|nr:putative candidate secreted effector protein [Blumeria hordei DH14]
METIFFELYFLLVLLGNRNRQGNPGKFRVIINIWGQILGVAVANFDSQSKETTYEKCIPVRKSVEEDSIQNSILNELWNIASPTLGFNCGLDFFPVFMVDAVMNVLQNSNVQDRVDRKYDLSYLEKYRGTDFKGGNLYSYPLRKSVSDKAASGLPGPFRIVFDMNNYKFKGIINVEDSKIKFRTVWDLSSIPPQEIYSPSSVLNLGREPDNYWPKTCSGIKFKSKAIWLYLEFVMKKWPSHLNGSRLNFPILREKVIWLWPIRTQGNQDNDRRRAFAIGHDTSLDTYGLYQANVRNGK